MLALCTIVALSVSYYFLIALPRDKRESLEIERQKLVALEAAKKRELINEDLLESCIQRAEVRYWEYIQLNGTDSRR